MIREMVKIDEELCNGCGICVPNCHEGALQMIDGKARLISDLMCDGLGACIGHCPQGAITIEKREAEAYDETKVMEIMVSKGKNTVIAHLKHLKDHNEIAYLKEAVMFLRNNAEKLTFSVEEVTAAVHGKVQVQPMPHVHGGGGCPGSRTVSFEKPVAAASAASTISGASELRQWPVQFHLINPNAPYFRNADVVVAADCAAFAIGDFHSRFLKGRSVAIGCPKLDEGTDVYIEKMVRMIDEALVNTINVVIMEVPCCGGLLRMVQAATAQAHRKVPVKCTIISIQGEVKSESWV